MKGYGSPKLALVLLLLICFAFSLSKANCQNSRDVCVGDSLNAEEFSEFLVGLALNNHLSIIYLSPDDQKHVATSQYVASVFNFWAGNRLLPVPLLPENKVNNFLRSMLDQVPSGKLEELLKDPLSLNGLEQSAILEALDQMTLYPAHVREYYSIISNRKRYEELVNEFNDKMNYLSVEREQPKESVP